MFDFAKSALLQQHGDDVDFDEDEHADDFFKKVGRDKDGGAGSLSRPPSTPQKEAQTAGSVVLMEDEDENDSGALKGGGVGISRTISLERSPTVGLTTLSRSASLTLSGTNTLEVTEKKK